MSRRRNASLAALVALTGCGAATPAASPRSTLAAFRDAAARQDLAAVYALLPARARRDESLEAFQRRMQGDHQELRDLTENVARTLGERRHPVVEVPLAGGGAATVVDDAEGWRLAQLGFGPVFASTPSDAARALRIALERQSLPAILQVLSPRARGVIQAEMAALIDGLREPPAPASSTTGAQQRHEIHLPDGRTLVMVREGQQWRVDDVQ